MRIYPDPSVFGGCFDSELKVPAGQLFEMFARGDARLVLSDLTRSELDQVPWKVPTEYIEQIGTFPEALELAQLYLLEGVVGPKTHLDAVHVAIATIARVDVLVSWNFRDIVNLQKIGGYNAVNVRVGYPPLEIRPPNAVIPYGDPPSRAVEFMRQIRDQINAKTDHGGPDPCPPTSSR